MLELRDVHTYYGDSHVLQGLSLTVEWGQVVSLLGRNGAGKTTTVHSIINFVTPIRGQIRFKEQEITGRAPHQISAMGIAIVPQGRRLFPDLTVRENITLATRPVTANHSWNLDKIYDLFPVLQEREHHRAEQLSGGEQQMVAIARALMMNPELLLMDEPSEGLAPLLVRRIGEVLLELKQHQLSILLVEQNLALATHVADKVDVLSKGKIVYSGTPESLLENSEVKTRYLGV